MANGLANRHLPSAICHLLSAFTPRLRRDFRRRAEARLSPYPELAGSTCRAYSSPSTPVRGLCHRGGKGVKQENATQDIMARPKVRAMAKNIKKRKLTDDDIVQRNLNLQFAFNRYIFDNPEML